MDLFSLMMFLFGSAIGGIIGSRTDALFCHLVRVVTERLKQGDPPLIRDLQQAVYKAYLQATIVVCEACLKELGVAPNILLRDLRTVVYPSKDVRWLDKVLNFFHQELRRLPHADYMQPSTEAARQFELLLQPKSMTASRRVKELRAALLNDLLDELCERHGELPARFTEMVCHGWDETTIHPARLHMDWFELLCAFFNHEIENNEKVRGILESQLLAKLNVEGIPLTVQTLQAQFEELGKEMVNCLERVVVFLAQLQDEGAVRFSEVQERMDEIIPRLALLPDIKNGQERIEENLQVVLREVRCRPLYEQYAGLEVADRVDKMVLDHTTLFVGRHDEWQRLDAFLQENPSGIIIVTAKAGFGKTSLLANWVASRKSKGCFTAYHFFSNRHMITRSITQAYRNLLRQLYLYHGLADQPIPQDENSLRETLYGILADKGAREGDPLIMVLDALDEADRLFSPPFPASLANGIFIVASARADEEEEPEYLRNWTPLASRLHLKRLGRSAIADWLRQSSNGELAKFAEDEGFIIRLDETTEGFPLYISFLIDEMIQMTRGGEDIQSVLTSIPQGFGNYVREQLLLMAQEDVVRRQREVQKVFGLLAVALEPLSEEDIQALTVLTTFELKALPWQVRRWFNIQTDQANKHFYSFTHAQLAKEFENALGPQADKARASLLEYCTHWHEHKSSYALRHYAKHLYDAKRWEDLLALARNKVFSMTQQAHLRQEPELPLETVRMALLSAAEIDNARAMAEFLLTHARLLKKITQESPLEALRHGNPKRAWELADLMDVESCVLWHLLLAWELKDKGKFEEASKTLDRLRGKKIPHLSYWADECAVHLIAYLFDVSKEILIDLQQQVLDDEKKGELIEWLVAREDFDISLRVAGEITDDEEKAKAFANIAKAQARTTDFTGALETAREIGEDSQRAEAVEIIVELQAQTGHREKTGRFLEGALEVAKEIKIDWRRSEVQASISKGQAEMGNIPAALFVARKIKDSEHKALALKNIAVEQARRRKLAAAISIFANAIKIALTIEQEAVRVSVLAAIAVGQLKIGKPAESKATFALARGSSKRIKHGFNRAIALSNLAVWYLRAKKVAEARVTLNEARKAATSIEASHERNYVLEKIALAQASEGKFLAALRFAQLIDKDSSLQDQSTFPLIAKTQAQMGKIPAAFRTVQKIGDERDQASALRTIVETLVEQGDFNTALNTARRITREHDREEAFGMLIVAQAHMGDCGAIQVIANELGKSVTLARTLATISNLSVTPEVAAVARTILSTILGAYEGIEMASNKADALRIISVVHAKFGRISEAQTTFIMALERARQIKHDYTRAMELAEIGITMMDVKKEAGAQVIINEALRTALDLEDGVAKATLLRAIAVVLAEEGNLWLARSWFAASIETASKIQDLNLKVSELLSIAIAQRNIGETAEARATLAEATKALTRIGKRSFKELALQEVAIAQAELGDISNAFATAKKTKDKSYWIKTLSSIAKVQKRLGKTTEALATFAKATKASRRIKAKGMRGLALQEVAIAQAEAGYIAMALETANGIESGFREMALEIIAIAQAEAGEIAKAFKTLGDIKGRRHRENVLVAIAEAQIKAGEVSATTETLQGIEDEEKRAELLQAISKRQAQLGLYQQAVQTANTILIKRNMHLPEIAAEFVNARESEYFKRFLIPGAYYIDAAHKMCGLLAFLYPQQARALAEIIEKETT